MFRLVTKSIGIKLAIFLSLALIVILTIITLMNVIFQNKTFFVVEKDTAKKLSDTVMTAVSYPMTTGDQEVIQKQFDDFTKLPGIVEMEMTDHLAVIKRATNRNELGKKFEDIKTPEQSENLRNALRGTDFSDLEGHSEGARDRVFTVIKSIANEKACFSCHGNTLKVLGTLRIVLSWGALEQQNLTRNILFSLIGLILMASLVFFLLKKMLTQPVKVLINGTIPLSAGDLTKKFTVKTQDELGRLSDAFNNIVNSMHVIVSQVRNSADRVASSAEEMSSSTEEMNATTQEVSSAIQKVSKGANNQAERLQETFETLQKAAESIKQIIADAQAANQSVSDTNVQAEASKAQAKETVTKIERLTITVNDTAKVILALGEMSQQIGEITVTITSIADQTNLLALNAAIEAARAGEAGKGFAVVAEEVRKLAEGSAEAVRKIGGLIRAIQGETNRAVNAIEMSSREVQESTAEVGKIAEVLSEISKGAQESYRLTNGISEAGQKRVLELERVVKSVNEVADIAKESASSVQDAFSSTEEQTASMEEMSASAQEFARLALDLKEVVGKFKLDERKSSSE